MKSPQEMVEELMESGLTQQIIADHLGVTQPTISRILSGSDTKYQVGKRIEILREAAIPQDGSSSGESETPFDVSYLRTHSTHNEACEEDEKNTEKMQLSSQKDKPEKLPVINFRALKEQLKTLC